MIIFQLIKILHQVYLTKKILQKTKKIEKFLIKTYYIFKFIKYNALLWYFAKLVIVDYLHKKNKNDEFIYSANVGTTAKLMQVKTKRKTFIFVKKNKNK